MECLIAFLLVFVGMLALGGVGAANRLQGNSTERTLKALAKRYAGTFVSGGWFRAPVVQLRYGSDRVRMVVYPAKHSKRGYTHVVIDYPDPALRCEVVSRWAYVPNQSDFAGLAEVRVSAGFDHRYVVLASDPQTARALLVENVRWRIEHLRQLAGDDFIHVSFKRGELEVVKQRTLTRFEMADELVRGVGHLYDQCLLTRTVGIEFVAGDDLEMIREATCQVCGEEVVTDMVFCRRCRTPHHLECWQYLGNCAIYGCQETRFFAPHLAQPADLPGEGASPPSPPSRQ